MMLWRKTVELPGLSAKKRSGDRDESGNILFWILIVVVLFAALNFTVGNMIRGGESGVTREMAGLHATDITQFSATVRRNVANMRLNGVGDNDLCFFADGYNHTDYDHDGCAAPQNRVFSSGGGNVIMQRPGAEWYGDFNVSPATAGGEWVFSAYYMISGANNPDIVMATAPIRNAVCEALNQMIGLAGHAPQDIAAGFYNNMATNKFDGTFPAGSDVTMPREACVRDESGYNVYYRVLVSR